MAEKVIIFEADIKIDEAVAETARLQKEVNKLREEKERLRKTEGDTSEAYVKANAEYKAQNEELRKSENLTKQLTSAQNANIGTIQKLQAQNAKLKNEQRGLNLETKEGKKRNEEINKTINENNAFISENSDKLAQNKMNIGNYASALDDMAGGFAASTKAALKFIATPIGAIIAAIVVVVTAVVKAFQRSEESMNKVKQVTGALSGAFSGLLNMLKPVVNFIADSVIVVFETLGKVADRVIGFVSKGLSALGFEGAAKAVDNFTQKIKESAKAGMDLAKMEAELQKAQRQSQKIQLDYQKQAEKLRQLRDDETRAIGERIKSNEELGKVLKKQMSDELRIANLSLSIAKRRVELDGESTANLDALAEAQTRVSDIQERITSQESEQLTNLNSLRREQNALIKEDENAFKDFFNTLSNDSSAGFKEMQDSIVKTNDEVEKYLSDSKTRQLEEDEQIRANKVEALKTDFENEMAILEMNENTKFEAQRLRNERRKEEEIRAAEEIGASVELINEKYRAIDLELERAKVDAKLALSASFMGGLAQLFDQGTAIGKAAAVAETIINTYRGAQAAFAQTPGGIGIKTAAAGLATAIGFKNVKKILATKKGSTGGAGSETASAPIANAVNPSVSMGAVSGAVGTSTGQMVTNAVGSSTKTQIAVVVDDVTAKQNQQTNANKLATL